MGSTTGIRSSISRPFFPDFESRLILSFGLQVTPLLTTNIGKAIVDACFWRTLSCFSTFAVSYVYRFHDHERAVGAYEDVLRPPVSICDVTYWLNFLNAQKKGRRATINTAGTATLGPRVDLQSRMPNRLTVIELICSGSKYIEFTFVPSSFTRSFPD